MDRKEWRVSEGCAVLQTRLQAPFRPGGKRRIYRGYHLTLFYFIAPGFFGINLSTNWD